MLAGRRDEIPQKATPQKTLITVMFLANYPFGQALLTAPCSAGNIATSCPFQLPYYESNREREDHEQLKIPKVMRGTACRRMRTNEKGCAQAQINVSM